MHTSLLSFTEDDVQMRFAIEEAQRTLKQFFDSFSRPKPDQEHFLEFHPTQITDWMYVESGYLVGGYTTQVVRNAMSMAERAEYDAAAPYRFRNAL